MIYHVKHAEKDITEKADTIQIQCEMVQLTQIFNFLRQIKHKNIKK